MFAAGIWSKRSWPKCFASRDRRPAASAAATLCLLLPLLLLLLPPAAQRVRGATLGPQRPVSLSEYKLRSSIEALNVELRKLKRDFAAQVESVYLRLKSEPAFAFRQNGSPATGAEAEEESASSVPVALLVAEQFSAMATRVYLIQRRLLAALKVLYVRLLPVGTLRVLVRKFPASYAWLAGRSQLDLRPAFAGAKGE